MSITLQHVSKSYGTEQVVRDVSLHVETGELFVLLGASGSGKSSLLRLIAGLLPVDSGRILLHDRDVTALSPQARGTGFVFQNYSLFRHMTVADNIAFGLSIRKVRRAEQRAKVEELLDLIDLHDCGDRLPTQLSGGQQQRVALARALIIEPRVLLLDEPLSNLDAHLRDEMRDLIRQVQQTFGITTIIVTHDQQDAVVLADVIALMRDGEVQQFDSPDALFNRPINEQVARFFGSVNFLTCTSDGHVARTEVGPFEISSQMPSQRALLTIRPEHIRIVQASSNTLQGVIEAQQFMGTYYRILVRVPESSVKIIAHTTTLPNQMAERVTLHFPPEHLWIIPQD